MSYTITRGGLKAAPKRELSLDHDGKNFLLATPFGKAPRLKEEVQVTWDAKRKLWVLPDLNLYANSALEIYPELPLTQRALERLERRIPAFAPGPSRGGDRLQAVYDKLYGFQQESTTRLVLDPKKNQQVVLSPGLGKTVVSLLAARLLQLDSVLIVCIKELMRQWQDEEEKWFGERTLIRLHGETPGAYEGHGPDRIQFDGERFDGWYVANYDTVVGRLHDAFETHHWDAVILDESVLVKNRKTRRFKRLLDLRHKDVDRFWELSGSPATRFKDDLWAQMHLLYPEDFRSYWRFARRFCVVESNDWSMATIIDDRKDRDTKEDLNDLQFVRNQKDVLKDLPEEIPVLVPVELLPAQRKAYEEMNDKFVTELESGKKVKASIVLSQLIRLQQITSNLINLTGPSDEPKKGTKYVDPNDISAKADTLVDMIEAGSIEFPALVWVNWVPGAKALYRRLCRVREGNLRVEWIHGAESKKDERHNEEAFLDYKANEVDILVLAIPVGKFGQNLQNTRTVVYYDKTWQADDFVQSMKRVKRIGLDHRPVVITLKALNTTDEMIEQNLAGKLPPISSISNDDLASMLRSLTGEAPGG